MFGNAPRALWSRWTEPDERGRILLACRALLIEANGRKILLETGVGVFFDPEKRDRYGVEEADHILLRSLAALGLDDSDIDVVVLSHLHFDHAGGLLAAWQRGTAPSLLFPKARFVVGRTAFERAERPHPRDHASFIADLPRLLQRTGRLELVDAAGTTAALGAPFSAFESDGHTPGLLHVVVSGTRQEIVFCSDLIPGSAWLRPNVTMGYDRFPELLVDEKRSLCERAAERGSWLFLTHDPEIAAVRIARQSDGGFGVVETCSHVAASFDLDA